MTGPKIPRNEFRLPFTCHTCNEQLQETTNPIDAVEELERHLAEVHGIEVDQ